jgi:cell division protein FtsL
MSTRTDTRRAPARGGRPAAKAAAPAKPKRADKAAPSPAKRTRPKGGAQGRAPRIPFVLLVLCLLGATLVSLLVLRSVVAEEAYAIANLKEENRELSQEEQQLRSTVAQLESSERISGEAEGMGMEQGEAPLFLDPASGEVSGVNGSGE